MKTRPLYVAAALLFLAGCALQAESDVDDVDAPELGAQETTTPTSPTGSCTVKCGSNNETCSPGDVLFTGTKVGNSCCSATQCSVCDAPDYYQCTTSKVLAPIGTSPPLLQK